jgi:ankyrin repeat protein
VTDAQNNATTNTERTTTIKKNKIKDNQLPIHAACAHSHTEIAKVLVSYGSLVNPEDKSTTGRTLSAL